MRVLFSLGYSLEKGRGGSNLTTSGKTTTATTTSSATSSLISPLSQELWDEFDVEGNIVDVLLNGHSGAKRKKGRFWWLSMLLFYTAIATPIVFLMMLYFSSGSDYSLNSMI
jgi:hypothetical protein